MEEKDARASCELEHYDRAAEASTEARDPQRFRLHSRKDKRLEALLHPGDKLCDRLSRRSIFD